jgi:hypothetical protein
MKCNKKYKNKSKTRLILHLRAQALHLLARTRLDQLRSDGMRLRDVGERVLLAGERSVALVTAEHDLAHFVRLELRNTLLQINYYCT